MLRVQPESHRSLPEGRRSRTAATNGSTSSRGAVCIALPMLLFACATPDVEEPRVLPPREAGSAAWEGSVYQNERPYSAPEGGVDGDLPEHTPPAAADATTEDAATPRDAASAPPPPPPPPPSCAAVGGVTYGALSVLGASTDRPAPVHGDLNLALRRYEAVAEARGLVHYDGDTDLRAPRLNTLLSDDRVPSFSNVYHLQGWDWSCNCPSSWLTDPYPVQLVGFAVTPGERLDLPVSGYDVGGGYGAMVLYATEDQLTLKYTREDNVVYGYTIHLLGLCTEPSLLAAYRAADAAGRRSLPALRGNQPLGRARGAEVLVALRDTGSLMDPRSAKDWWP